jgi:hypothetical protein
MIHRKERTMNGEPNQNSGNVYPDGQQEGKNMNEQEHNQAGYQQYNQPEGMVYAAGRKVRNPNLPYKSPALATWLSLFPGLGQAYIGYYQLGFMYVLIMALCILILSNGVLAPFFGPMLAFFWIFNLIDANRRAHNANRALDGLEGNDVPPDFEMPGLKGSVPVGVMLMIAGILILLDLRFNVSLSWIEDWWPIGLVGLGGWLVFKSRQGGK